MLRCRFDGGDEHQPREMRFGFRNPHRVLIQTCRSHQHGCSARRQERKLLKEPKVVQAALTPHAIEVRHDAAVKTKQQKRLQFLENVAWSASRISVVLKVTDVSTCAKTHSQF